jgi:Arylsulfatase A and related enzymes
MHRRPGRIHPRADTVSHGSVEGRHARRQTGAAGLRPTIAELLKPHGYATAQIGKNHLGDRNEYLPTVHGFDEFYGILYHLNAMEEPYEDDFPKDPKFKAKFGPRNIIDTKATSKDDSTTDPRWGKVGKQTIKDGGPLPPGPGLDKNAKFDMTNVDEELVRRSNDFMERSVKAGKPFFLWHNTTRTHVWTHLAPKWAGKSGFGMYADAMMDLDDKVGKLLKKVDDLGIADNTIVLFTSDNGAEVFTWPDGGNTPFRGEKGTTYEGGFRAPMLVKWPGTIKPGTIYNDIMSAEGLDADPGGCRRRSEGQREASQRSQGARQDIQEPSGRL